ncbi:MAG: hypothetical protein CM15mP120_01000 [Pseudomonadota bacterium]|nr:MAG: hypothetical protein CM15mP120_01000 [Pseudomonadota bacterium]
MLRNQSNSYLKEQMSNLPSSGRQLRTEVTSAGEPQTELSGCGHRPLNPNKGIVRIEASPINPSDLGLLLGMADVSTARRWAVTTIRPSVPRCQKRSSRFERGWGESMPVGNEGGGVVGGRWRQRCGSSAGRKDRRGIGGAMYGEYRTLHVSQCLVMHDGVTPRESASCFVNPLTARHGRDYEPRRV